MHSCPNTPSSVLETVGSPLQRLLFGLTVIATDTTLITYDDPRHEVRVTPGLLTDVPADFDTVLLLVDSQEIANVVTKHI